MVGSAPVEGRFGGREEDLAPAPMAEPGPSAAPPSPIVGSGAGRERILREARRLFAERGFAAVSMQQIADGAAVNKATLYHHVRDKEELFLAVMAEEVARSRAEIAAAASGEGSLRERLRRVAAHLAAGHRSDLGRLMGDLRHHVAAERREALFAGAPPWQGIAPAVADAVAAGEVRPVDPDLVARLFFAMAVSQGWWRGPGAEPVATDHALAGELVDVLLDGIAFRTHAEVRGTANPRGAIVGRGA